MQLHKSNRTVLKDSFNVRRRIHFVGIGGAGMGSIAIILVQKGYYVTGSDIVNNDTIQYLIKLGVKKVFLGHHYNNVKKSNIVVISSAIGLDNPEVQAAKKLNIPVIKRALVLSELMRDKYSIAISGTHGKTTTTAMLTNICIKSGLNPTFINGAIIKSEKVQARLGYGHYLIVEADESDRSFLCLNPAIVIVTNVDADHLNAYYQNFNNLKKAFVKFLNNLPIYGYGVVCVDDPAIRQILFKIDRKIKIITYGFSKDADFCILNYVQFGEKSTFTVLLKNSKKLNIVLNIPGYHNVLNAVAAIAVSIEEGIHDANIVKSMLNFQGIKRRFENLGNYSLKNINGQIGSVIIIDDYGHHPTELHASINTVRKGWPSKRLIMIFQPHRFTRTYDLYDDFIDVLSKVDILLVLDIYAAGEEPILGINSQSLCYAIDKNSKTQCIFIPNQQVLLQNLYKLLKDNDLILIQGAGTIGEVGRRLFID